MKRFLWLLVFLVAVPTLAWADDDGDKADEAPAAPPPPRPARLPRAGTTVRVPPVPPVPPAPAAPAVPPPPARVGRWGSSSASPSPSPSPHPNPTPRPQVNLAWNDDNDDGDDDDDSDSESPDQKDQKDQKDHRDQKDQKHAHRHNGVVDQKEIDRIVRDAQELARRELERAEKELGTQLGEAGREAVRAAREALQDQNQHLNEQVRDIQRMAREQARQAVEQVRQSLEAARLQGKFKFKMKDKDKRKEDCGDCDVVGAHEFPAPPMPPMPPMAPMAPRPPRAPRAIVPHGEGTAVLAVGGPVAFHLETIDGDVEIVGMSTNQVQLSGPGCAPSNVRFQHAGEDVEAELDVSACHGPLKVTMPTGSEVHVNTTNGDIVLRGAFADVQLQAVSGDISVDHAANAEISTVNGDVVVRDATGRVKAETVSGDAKISMSSPSPRLQFQSTSGDLVWSGLCGKGCRLEAELYSGDVVLQLDPRSSFNLKYASQTGDFSDDLGMGSKESRGSTTRGAYGHGEGAVSVETFSGDLRINRR